ncbi:hypothetical protein IGI04_025546 [Brassica rapa subsp. trilocularis]|uniref:Uncharacterized protein n=1 Tax=Brassica rapa subsp. trilocularis TaxID=1813537 RepID=A0ABQ7KTW2_BRACM|nr:hypothetical protein IGI04_025546 [Brassica rapa subsp. trilocularis]
MSLHYDSGSLDENQSFLVLGFVSISICVGVLLYCIIRLIYNYSYNTQFPVPNVSTRDIELGGKFHTCAWESRVKYAIYVGMDSIYIVYVGGMQTPVQIVVEILFSIL